jgi:fucose permease
MERVRDTTSATAGLAPSVFWTGMAIGRIALGPVTEHFDLNVSISSYILLSICTQALFRFIRSTPIFLALLGANGFFLAPPFPSGIVLLAKKLPGQVHVGAVAAGAATGQLGAGLAPLLVGFMADHLGINRLLDVMLGLSVVMLVVWTAYVRYG